MVKNYAFIVVATEVDEPEKRVSVKLFNTPKPQNPARTIQRFKYRKCLCCNSLFDLQVS